MPVEEVRFTPEELKELVDSGDLNWDDLAKMNPADRAVGQKFLLAADRPYGQTQGEMGGPIPPPWMVGLKKFSDAIGFGGGTPPAVPPSNVIKQGNVTRPGPNGTGSPSVPSGPVDNPLDRANPYKGPMGNEDNWRTLGPRTPKVERQSPTLNFDEADKRKVMFGGAGNTDAKGKLVPPSQRKPVGRKKPK